MADESKIGWTDHTFNPWMGCQEWSEGCRNCYARVLTKNRMGIDVFGNREWRQRTSEALWKRPATWNRASQRDHGESDGLGRTHRAFCASLADVFEDAPGPNAWRAEVWDVIRAAPWLDWQLLTKRPENVERMLPDDWGRGWPNVWLGTSIEDRRVVERAEILGEIPAFRRFISYEPAIGPILPEEVRVETWKPEAEATTYRWLDDYEGPGLRWYNSDGDHAFHWIIAGGESGQGFRPFDLQWARDVRDQCATEEVAFFFKQIAHYQPGQGEDALGEGTQQFPTSWDRADLEGHAVFTEPGALV